MSDSLEVMSKEGSDLEWDLYELGYKTDEAGSPEERSWWKYVPEDLQRLWLEDWFIGTDFGIIVTMARAAQEEIEELRKNERTCQC